VLDGDPAPELPAKEAHWHSTPVGMSIVATVAHLSY